MKITRKAILYIILVSGIVILFIYSIRPSPLLVEIGIARHGMLRVTLDAQGEVRFHEKYDISAPISGKIKRIGLMEGDSISPTTVLVALSPPPLDSRQEDEARAHAASAEAVSQEATEEIAQLRPNLDQAKRKLERFEKLYKTGGITLENLEIARDAEMTIQHQMESLQFRAKAARFDVLAAESALRAVSGGGILGLKAPIFGKVLKIFEKNERTVPVGTKIMEIGNSSWTELVIDVLSSDAVKVKVGASVIVEGWGGDKSLSAKVRLIEPAAYTKISALGIEEKRVNIIADLIEKEATIGDGYRVQTKILLWENQNALKIPSSSLFRQGESWSVFVLENGRVKRRTVEVGNSNGFEAEILSGLSESEKVIQHPSNQIVEGISVKSIR